MSTAAICNSRHLGPVATSIFHSRISDVLHFERPYLKLFLHIQIMRRYKCRTEFVGSLSQQMFCNWIILMILRGGRKFHSWGWVRSDYRTEKNSTRLHCNCLLVYLYDIRSWSGEQNAIKFSRSTPSRQLCTISRAGHWFWRLVQWVRYLYQNLLDQANFWRTDLDFAELTGKL